MRNTNSNTETKTNTIYEKEIKDDKDYTHEEDAGDTVEKLNKPLIERDKDSTCSTRQKKKRRHQ